MIDPTNTAPERLADPAGELATILRDAGVSADRARELAWETVCGLWDGPIDREIVERAVRSGEITEAEAEEFIKNG